MSSEGPTSGNDHVKESEKAVSSANLKHELGQDSFIPDLQKVHAAGRHLLDLILENFASTQVDAGPAESETITFTRHQALAREPTKKGEIAAGPTQTASLLVVDDNELNRDMLTRRLERLG